MVELEANDSDDDSDDEWDLESVLCSENSNEPTLEQKRRAIDFADTVGKNGKKPKLGSVCSKFRFVKSHEQLNRWRKQSPSGKLHLMMQVMQQFVLRIERLMYCFYHFIRWFEVGTSKKN